MCDFPASLALACDYDGTLAEAGVVSIDTIAALERFVDSGKRLFLVTGRLLPELNMIFSRLDLFDCVVAENKPVLFNPRTGATTILARWPCARFIAELRKLGVTDLGAGEAVVATARAHEAEAAEAIRRTGLDLQIVYNKESLMVLPAGMDKMTGLMTALEAFDICRERVVAVGDGENDEPLLEGCGYGVAVANAIPELKAKADMITAGERGAGVVELIDHLLRTPVQS